MMQTLKNWLGIIFELILRSEKTLRIKIVELYKRLGLDGIVDKIVSKVFSWFGIGFKNSDEIDASTAIETELEITWFMHQTQSVEL